MDPTDILTIVVNGAGFSLRQFLTISLVSNHNRDPHIDNLLVGAGTHPGVGLPVISSAKKWKALSVSNSADSKREGTVK